MVSRELAHSFDRFQLPKAFWQSKVHLNFGGPGVSFSLCCFVVYSTRRFVLSFALCYFVLVIFTLLFDFYFSPFSFAITSLGEERANLSTFRTIV